MKVNMGQPNNDLLIDDLELLLREIDEFNTATGNNKPVDIPQTLNNYLQFVAKSGNTVFPWPHVRMLFRIKLMNAIQQFQEPACPSEGFILERFDMFRIAAPFTIQRLTELILQPTRHYRKKEKFLRGLEKTVLVVSTIEPRSLTGEEDRNGSDDVINTSASSGEGDAENASLNRTYSMERLDQQQEMATVRSSPIDVLGQNIIAADSMALDPVTTSAVFTSSTTVDAIHQTISVTADGIIADGVTTSSVSSVDVITPDIAIVSSDSIILNASTTIVSEDVLTSPMECESSTTAVEVTPVTLLQCVTKQDLVSTAISRASGETLVSAENVGVVLEDVSSSLVSMDAVKLPIEESNNVPVDCHSSAAPVSSESGALFSCITPDPNVSALVTPLVAGNPDAVCINETNSASVAAPASVAGGEEKNALVDVKPEDADALASTMECQSSEELSSVAQLRTLEHTSSTTTNVAECATLASGTESGASELTSSGTATAVETADLSGEILASAAEESSGSTDATDLGSSNENDQTSDASIVVGGDTTETKTEDQS